MWVKQKIGPFNAGTIVDFKIPASEDYPWHFIRLGIQCPQSPILSEVNLEKNAKEQVMNTFEINANVNNADKRRFVINANEIIEFDNLDQETYFKIKPLQYCDEYTIIEIQYLDKISQS